MDLEDDLPLSDEEFVISPAARRNLETMKGLLEALQGDLEKTLEDGAPLPGSAWSWTLRQAAALRVQEMLVRMEDILENRAPDGAIARLTSELLGDYVAAVGVCRAVDLVVDTFRLGPDFFSRD